MSPGLTPARCCPHSPAGCQGSPCAPLAQHQTILPLEPCPRRPEHPALRGPGQPTPSLPCRGCRGPKGVWRNPPLTPPHPGREGCGWPGALGSDAGGPARGSCASWNLPAAAASLGLGQKLPPGRCSQPKTLNRAAAEHPQPGLREPRVPSSDHPELGWPGRAGPPSRCTKPGGAVRAWERAQAPLDVLGSPASPGSSAGRTVPPGPARPRPLPSTVRPPRLAPGVPRAGSPAGVPPGDLRRRPVPRHLQRTEPTAPAPPTAPAAPTSERPPPVHAPPSPGCGSGPASSGTSRGGPGLGTGRGGPPLPPSFPSTSPAALPLLPGLAGASCRSPAGAARPGKSRGAPGSRSAKSGGGGAEPARDGDPGRECRRSQPLRKPGLDRAHARTRGTRARHGACTRAGPRRAPQEHSLAGRPCACTAVHPVKPGPCVHTSPCTRVRAHTNLCTNKSVLTQIHARTSLCTRKFVHTQVCAHMSLRTQVGAHTQTRTSANTQLQACTRGGVHVQQCTRVHAHASSCTHTCANANAQLQVCVCG